MNLKKIWLMGIMFGLIASILFYYAVSNNTSPTSPVENTQLATETIGTNTSTVEGSTMEDTVKTDSEQLLNIENGKRAISIPVNNYQSVSGFILPEDYVDIISIMPTLQGQDSTPQIILENIKVLATGDRTEINNNSAPGNENTTEMNEKIAFEIITLEVTPEQGKLLANSAQNGFVTLMLRDKDDNTLSSQKAAKTEDLNKGENAQ